MNLSWLFFAVAFLVGALITVQTGSNARLKDSVRRTDPVASLPTLAGTPWWAWAGGALGAVYAVAAVLLARELGAAALMSLVVTGQLICSVVLDHFGWGGLHRTRGGHGADRGLF